MMHNKRHWDYKTWCSRSIESIKNVLNFKFVFTSVKMY